MNWILISFALYTVAIVAIGLWSARRATRDDEDYFLAGRTLGPWMAALSAGASAESAWVTMGLVGLAFATGFQAYWLVPGLVVGYVFNWFFLARRLRDQSVALGALTLPDFFSLHFRERAPLLRIMSVIVILVAMLLYAAAQLAAAGKAFDFALGDGVTYGHGVVIAGIWMLLIVWGAVTIGIMARALAEGGAEWGAGLLLTAGVEGAIDRENALIVTAASMLPAVLAGLVLAAILAAICSTADSQIVIAASALANDLWVRLVRRDTRRGHPAINRIAVVALGIGAMVLVIDQDVNVY